MTGEQQEATTYQPPEFEPVEEESEKNITHNGAPDRFVMCSGGMDSVAMAHYMIQTDSAYLRLQAEVKR